MDTETIVAVHRNHFGDIISFQTTNGRIISYRKALQEVESGMIGGVNVTEVDDGISLLTPAVDGSFDHFPSIY